MNQINTSFIICLFQNGCCHILSTINLSTIKSIESIFFIDLFPKQHLSISCSKFFVDTLYVCSSDGLIVSATFEIDLYSKVTADTLVRFYIDGPVDFFIFSSNYEVAALISNGICLKIWLNIRRKTNHMRFLNVSMNPDHEIITASFTENSSFLLYIVFIKTINRYALFIFNICLVENTFVSFLEDAEFFTLSKLEMSTNSIFITDSNGFVRKISLSNRFFQITGIIILKIS